MNQNKLLISTIPLFVLLAIIGLVLIVVLSTFRVTSPSSFSSTRGSTQVIASSTMANSPSPSPDETQTAVALVTFKAVEEATELARTPAPFTPIYLPTGIFEREPVKYSGKLVGLDAQNGWSGFVEGIHYFLYAGALLSDPEQGAVVLVIDTPKGNTIESFITPTKHGALSAVSEQNNRLTLVASDETIYYFDLPTRQFVASLTEVAPSVTPSPLVTPVPTGLPYPLPETSTVAP